MSIFVWNVRCPNKERRHDLREHLATLKPSLVILVKTKVKPHNKHRILKCIPRHLDSRNNYEFSSLGRVWICWDTNIWACEVGNKSMQQITYRAYNKGVCKFSSMQCMAQIGKVKEKNYGKKLQTYISSMGLYLGQYWGTSMWSIILMRRLVVKCYPSTSKRISMIVWRLAH